MESRGIVISKRTIYTEGVVNLLRENKFKGDIQFIDLEDDDFIRKVSHLNPSVIIFDSMEHAETQFCVLCELLEVFPGINIIRLNVQDKDIQVITSSTHELGNVQDLFNLIGLID